MLLALVVGLGVGLLAGAWFVVRRLRRAVGLDGGIEAVARPVAGVGAVGADLLLLCRVGVVSAGEAVTVAARRSCFGGGAGERRAAASVAVRRWLDKGSGVCH